MLIVLAAASYLAACGSGGSNLVGPPGGGNGGGTPTPTPTPMPQRLYVSDNANPGSIYAFALPLSPASTPAAVLAGTGSPGSMTFDSLQRLFVSDNGMVKVFAQPIVGGAAPSFMFGNGRYASAIAVDAQGNAYFGQCVIFFFCRAAVVNVFTAPLSAASTVQYTIQIQGGPPHASPMAFDKNGNLWVSTGLRLSSSSRMLEFKPPFSAASAAALQFSTPHVEFGLAFDSAGNLYAAGKNGIDVYAPPFTATSTEAFTISMPGGAAAANIAFDNGGKAYVSDANGNVQVFAAPFSANSTPVVTLPVAGAPASAGLAIGP